MKIILLKTDSTYSFKIQVNKCNSYGIFHSQKHNGWNASHALITFFSHVQQVQPRNDKELILLYDHLENQRLNNVN